jgi:hypothetical protein
MLQLFPIVTTLAMGLAPATSPSPEPGEAAQAVTPALPPAGQAHIKEFNIHRGARELAAAVDSRTRTQLTQPQPAQPQAAQPQAAPPQPSQAQMDGNTGAAQMAHQELASASVPAATASLQQGPDQQDLVPSTDAANPAASRPEPTPAHQQEATAVSAQISAHAGDPGDASAAAHPRQAAAMTGQAPVNATLSVIAEQSAATAEQPAVTAEQLAFTAEQPANAVQPANAGQSVNTAQATADAAPALAGQDDMQAAASPDTAARTEPALAALGQPVQASALADQRGGDLHSDMNLSGVVTGNSATNVVTGANSIDSGAFANMSGIPMVVQNSGANVLIQNATIVNVEVK